MSLISIIESSEKEFDEKFPQPIFLVKSFRTEDYQHIESDLKTHNRQTVLKLVEEIEKWAEDEKVSEQYISSWHRENAKGYNEALKDLLILLQPLKDKLKQ